MSNANQVSLAAVLEVTPGVAPGTQLQNLNYTNDSLIQNTSTVISKTIRSDRQVPAIIRTETSPSGGISFNWQYGGHELLLAGFMMNTWSADVGVVASANIGMIAIGAGTGTITNTSNWGAQVLVGQWIKVSGFVNAGNNGYFKVTAINNAASPKTMTLAQGSTAAGAVSTPVTEVAGPSVTVKGAAIQNGTTWLTYSLEKQYTDLSSIFDSFLGMTVGKFGLNIKPSAQIDGTFTLDGMKAALSGTATIGTGTNLAAATTQEMNAVDHVFMVHEGGAIATFSITDLTLDGDNHLRSRHAVSSLGPISIGLGQINLTGKLTVYFADRSLLDKARNHTLSSIVIGTKDDSGNAYIFDLEGIYYKGGDPVVTGSDTDVFASLDWEAQLGGNEGKMLTITKFAGP